MRVAARAADGESEPDGPRCLRAIHHGLDAELLLICAALGVGQCLPVKRGGDDLLRFGIRQKIAGNLLNAELVKGHVVIHRADHPVAVAPGIGPGPVFFITIRVGIARCIQPVTAPALAIVRIRQHAIDHGFISARGVILHKRIHGLRRGRQTKQVVVNALDECVAVGFGRWLDAFFRKLRTHQAVDGMCRFHVRQRWLNDGFVGPVKIKFGTVFDPGFQEFDFGGLERLFGLGRHPVIEITGGHTLDQLARGDVARDDPLGTAFQFLERAVARRQNKPAFRIIGPVAFQAVLGKQRLNVARVVGRIRQGGGNQQAGQGEPEIHRP